MSVIGSVSSFFQRQTPGEIDLSRLSKAGSIETPGLGGAEWVKAPQVAPSFGSILDHMVGEVDKKMAVGDAEQAKVLSGESTNLHQAMISMQEAGVAFSLMVEVRNKMVESYQELMRMQV
jgi:flagellar hook-basal body complex protein FliE